MNDFKDLFIEGLEKIKYCDINDKDFIEGYENEIEKMELLENSKIEMDGVMK